MNKTFDLNTMRYVTKTDCSDHSSPRNEQNMKIEGLSFSSDDKKPHLGVTETTMHPKKEFTTFDIGVQTEEFTWLQVSMYIYKLYTYKENKNQRNVEIVFHNCPVFQWLKFSCYL